MFRSKQKTKSLPKSSFLSPQRDRIYNGAIPRLLSIVIFFLTLILTIYHWSIDLLLLSGLAFLNMKINYGDKYE